MSKSCIVLDVDGTFLGSTRTKNKDNKDQYISHDGTSKVYCYIRPGTRQFIKNCKKLFDVIGIWSHGTEDWVEDFLKHIKISRKYFDFVLCRHHPGDWTKPLVWIHKKYGTDPKKTVMIDDTPDVVVRNKTNVFIVPEYVSSSKDRVLERLETYLFELVKIDGDFRKHTFKVKEIWI